MSDNKKETINKEGLNELLLTGREDRIKIKPTYSPELLETLKKYLEHREKFPLYSYGRIGARTFIRKLQKVFPQENLSRHGLERWIKKYEKKKGVSNE